MKILFVCMANIVRSFAAERMLKKALKENNRSEHFSKLLTEDIAAEADMILVMEQHHKDFIIENYPDTQKKVFLLKPFSKGASHLNTPRMEEIRDPHNLSSYHYRLCFAEIYLAIEGMLKCI
jgi:protein-tyrosine phosphatase